MRAAYLETLEECFVPRRPLTVSQWAKEFRIVPAGTSPEPGAWSNDRAPYLKDILDAVSDPTVERVHIQAASQVGKSEILLSAIGYFSHHEPAPILLIQATEDAVRSFSKERVAPMFAASPALCGLLSEGEKNPANMLMLRLFPGGMLACAWAGSAASLASRPIRVVLGDELDRWPDTTGRDGDPWAQAVQRTSNFFNRKIVAVSTPTVESFSAIARLYEDSDQRRYHVPCPRCGVLQELEWQNVIYKRDGQIDLDDIHYRCADCGGRIEEREKPAMVADGEWVAGNPGHRNRGYQISALYSPWVRWRELAEEWIRAHRDRDRKGKQEFFNLRLGLVWREANQFITVESLEKNRREYEAEVPAGALFLTAGVDVQDNRLEAGVVGWGVGKESWWVDYSVIVGDTSAADTWARLDTFLARSWSRADGRPVTLACTCIDSGGHRTQEVYEFCYARWQRNIFAIKGYAGPGRAIVGKPTQTNQRRINLFPVGVDAAKDTLFSRLALPDPGPGYVHFPVGGNFDDEFFRGLVSEVRATKKKPDGRYVSEWKPVRSRNEPLDVAVYSMAAMEILAPQIDWTALVAEEERARGSGPKPTAPVKRRRVLSRGVE